MNKLENAQSARVIEVQELAELLEQNGISDFGAMRIALESVYGMFDRFRYNGYSSIGVDRERQYEQEWQEAKYERCNCVCPRKEEERKD